MRAARLVIGVPLLAAASVAWCASPQPSGRAGTAPAGPRLVVEPNVLVSLDGDVSHAELYVAAHPTDPGKLIGMGTVFRDVGAKVTNEVFATSDGGQTWTGIDLPHQRRNGGGDPWVGYSRQGTGLAIGLIRAEKLWMWVYRSEDGGTSWDEGRKAGWSDHERLGVDLGTGRYAGRMYLGGEAGCPDVNTGRCSQVVLWRSDDDGRSWIGPVVAGRSESTGLGMNAVNVLADGTVAVYMTKYPAPNLDKTTPNWEHFLALSSDGAATFAPMRPIGLQYFGGYGFFTRLQAKVTVGQSWGGYDAAADVSSGKYRDRMYRVWNKSVGPNAEGRIVLSHSADRGQSWSDAAEIAPEPAPDASQFQPALAVNREGAVGVMWLDTGAAQGRDGWDAWFSVSLDGGASFLPARRVSSETSTPFAAGNVRPVPIDVRSTEKGVSATLYSGFSGFADGGDYMGVAADADGVFHPFWADARTGIYQVMTARVRVEAGAAPAAARPAGEPRSLAGEVTLDFDPARVDWSHGELLVPVRLRNVSHETLAGPFTVELRSVSTQSDDAAAGAVTKVLNASNGKDGAGAIFDYAGALRDLTGLAPGAVSEAVVWRVRPALLRNTNVTFEADVKGYRVAPAAKDGS